MEYGYSLKLTTIMEQIIMTENTQDKIIHKRFIEKKSYRAIAVELGNISFQYAQQTVAKYLEKHPELKPQPPPPKEIKVSLGIGAKGHSRNKNKSIGEMADILIAGGAAKPFEKYVKCGKNNCDICIKGAGHGPYIYLKHRDSVYGTTTPIYLGLAENVDLTRIIGKSFATREELLKCLKSKPEK